MKCPVCGVEKITPADRVGMEKMLRYAWPFSPYRCRDCWNRFWRFDRRLALIDAGMLCAVGIGIWGLLAVLDYCRTSDKPPVEVESGTAHRVLVKREAATDTGTTGPAPRMIPPPTEPYSGPPSPESPRAAAPIPSVPVPPASSKAGPPPLPSSVIETPLASSLPAPAPPAVPEAAPKPVKPEPSAKTESVVKSDPVAKPAESVPPESGEKAEAPAKPEEAVKPESVKKPEAVPTLSKIAPLTVEKKADPTPSITAPVEKGVYILSGLGVEKTAQGTRVTLSAGVAVANWKSFYLKDPSRVVIDVPGEWRVDVPGEMPGTGKPVRTLRVAAHPGFLRIVADLAPPSAAEPSISAEQHTAGLRFLIQ